MISIDLGSNTFRAAKIDNDDYKRVWQFERVVRSAENLNKSKIIGEDAKNRIIESIKELKSEHSLEDDEIVAVTTEAIRVAKNGHAVLKEIKEREGIDFKIISGEDEAYYTTLAIRESLKKISTAEDFMIVDIGGGSTEVIFSEKEKMVSKSFPIGIVTITEKYEKSRIDRYKISEELLEAEEFIRDMWACGLKPKHLVATAGTPTIIAALKQGMNYKDYDYEKINGSTLEIKDLKDELKKLLKLNFKDREKLVGVGRADLIITGVYILMEIFEISKFKNCIVIDDGLREGVAIAKIRGIF